MMQVQIRKANMADSTSISILSDALGYMVNELETSQYLDLLLAKDDNVVYVAELDNVVIGWIQAFYTIRIESGTFCEIAGLVVGDKYRSMGVGGMLIEACKGWCETINCKKLKVRSNIIREATKVFYIKKGFSIAKTQNVFEMDL